MVVNIDGNDIEVIIEKKANKNIYFRIKDDLKLYITCHRLVSNHEITKLIEKNSKALTRMYNKALSKQQKHTSFYYLGKPHTLVIDKNLNKCSIEDGLIFIPSTEALEKHLKKTAKEFFRVRAMELVKEFGYIPPFELKVRKMTTRWGVCNRTKKTITLNLELIKYDPSLTDYVIIHELCHFKHPHHQKEFWNEVGIHYPNYKWARKELKE